MNKKYSVPSKPFVAYLLFIGCIVFFLCALVYNEFFISLFKPGPPLQSATVYSIRKTQAFFVFIGIVFLLAAVLSKKQGWLSAILSKPFAYSLFLIGLSFILPVSIIELSLRPFAQPTAKLTTIFMQDPNLGWRHRPGVQDEWSNAFVKINNKGIRGPELTYKKPADTFRILYLGDSVTFGDRLSDHEQTFPYIIESILKAQSNKQFETINAGVSGYSQWQEYIYLQREGIRYQPDLVVLQFVLNDVTERFELIHFGGSSVGFQLSRTFISAFDRLSKYSSIFYFVRQINIRLRFGKNVQKGAIKTELINFHTLLYAPDSAEVKHAWSSTLQDMGKIISFCKQRNVPILLVIFPDTIQLDESDSRMAVPNKIVSQFAAESNIPCIDLLPLFRMQLKDKKLRLFDLFFDHCHLTRTGNQAAADTISKFILASNLFI